MPTASRLISLFTILSLLSSGAEGAGYQESEFTLKVLPLLKEKCLACHGDDPKKIKGGLTLSTRESMLQGGENSRHVLVPGDAEKSDLYVAVTWLNPDMEMPPKKNDRLNPEQVATLKAWIEAGAPWPDAESQKKHVAHERSQVSTKDGLLVRTSGGQSDAWTYRRYQPENLWPFQPLRSPSLPSDQAARPVDYFIGQGLLKAGQEPAPEADARTLLRRATFDLTGLPPTLEESQAFEKAWASDREAAWSALLDRLLASPRYGERWSQHWFDVVRYADTGGMANDFERSNLWRYRDWVIRAFNADMPYDRFVREQIAGDRLAEIAAARRLGGDAAGLDRTRREGAYTEEEARMMNAMVSDEEARQIYLDDLLNAVGQSFLSVTMRCFKCHDHKFDPLPTRDYYGFYAALAGTQMAERPMRFVPEENQGGFAEGKAFVRRLLDFARGEKDLLVGRREAAARQWYKEHGLPYKDADDRKADADEIKPPRNIGLDHVAEGQLKVREQDEWIWERALERYEPMIQGVFDGNPGKRAWNAARKLRMPPKLDEDWQPECHVLLGGSLVAPGEKAVPGTLSVLAPPGESAGRAYWNLPGKTTERRLALAEWIARPDNPLTTRSIVNRVWAYHFGKGLAANPNNFGAKGGRPTHPELLDRLAADFVKEGWSLKRLHRVIMTSKAYRMSAQHPRREDLAARDPNNDLLAYFPSRRLTAEEMRDAMLTVTGEMRHELGGLPVSPEINMEVALQPRMIQFSLAPAYQPSPSPAQRNRRSVYAVRVRGQSDPFLEIFNKPGANDSCERREDAAVSPQAFTLLNSDMMVDRSLAFARRLRQAGGDTAEAIRLAFRLALGRDASPEEVGRLTRYAEEMSAYHRNVRPERPVYPTLISRSLVEEFSGRTFEYQEILPAFEHYEPDFKAADADAATRALADVCLLLFNSHEFIYLN
ncbi:MAG: PSD1 and planctomycete cytochrome C domain-containing protein [Opitutales bacterium]